MVNVPFHDYLHLETLSAGEGKSEVLISISDHVVNGKGIVHGGAISSLIDVAIGVAVQSIQRDDQVTITSQLVVNFLAPGKGKYLLAKGEVVKFGSRLAFGQATVEDETGNTVATGSGSWVVMRREETKMRQQVRAIPTGRARPGS